MFKFVKSVFKLFIPSWILRWKFRNDLNEVFPSGRAVPSDQGIYKTCTRHALGKAIVDGFQNKIFDSREIDFDQDKVTDALIKMDPGKEMIVSALISLLCFFLRQ